MRFDRDSMHETLATLMRNKGRTLLTGFGVFWGVFMLLSLLGGSAGLKALLMENFEGFATNSALVYVQPTTKAYKGFRKGRNWDMDVHDMSRIKAMMPELDVVAAMNVVWNSSPVTYGQNSFSGANLSGITPDYIQIESQEIGYGRHLNEMDIQQARKVCVIGKRIYENLFPEGGDPCGNYIKMDDVYYQVVGVNMRSSQNININGNADSKVFVPFTTLSRLYNRGEHVDMMGMTAKPGYKMSELEPKIREVIANAHSVDPTDKQSVSIFNMEQIFGLMDSLFTGISLLMLLVGIGTILAGAIGVSNIMMVTVKERTTEIGIRRAIGATPSMIISQVITESMVLTLVSGLFGIVFSVFVLNLADMVASSAGKDFSFQISLSQALLSLLFLTILGVIAGLAPASRAMNIRPVDAMRDE